MEGRYESASLFTRLHGRYHATHSVAAGWPDRVLHRAICLPGACAHRARDYRSLDDRSQRFWTMEHAVPEIASPVEDAHRAARRPFGIFHWSHRLYCGYGAGICSSHGARPSGLRYGAPPLLVVGDWSLLRHHGLLPSMEVRGWFPESRGGDWGMKPGAPHLRFWLEHYE